MNKGRFLNQKLGKRASRKIALLKSRIQSSSFSIQAEPAKRAASCGPRLKPWDMVRPK